jgi:sterol desaturase/sphingolipid hydroxylase (fatty acid hydroxylase superfamily)
LNGFVAEYKSLIEALVVTTSDILPFLIFGTSINQLIAWIIVGVLYNVEGHSSMTLLYIVDNFHHKHHTHFNVNYGIAQYLDHIFGTM